MYFLRIGCNFISIFSLRTSLLGLILISSLGLAQNPQVLPKDTIVANRLVVQATDFARARNFDSAVYCFGQAAVEYKMANAWDRFFYAHYQAGYQFNASSKFAKTFTYLDSIAHQFSSYLNPELESFQNFYSVIAWSQFRQLKYEKALYYFDLMENGARQNPKVKPPQILFATYYRGVIYQRIGQYDLALKYMLKSRDISKDFELYSYLGRSYNNLGIIFRNLGEYERALEFYKKALNIDKQFKSEVALTPIYNNLGTIYYYLHEYDAALKELDYALKVLTNYTRDYYTVESSLITSKAKVLIELREYARAEKILQQVLAREIATHGEGWAGSAPTLMGLGETYVKIGNFKTSNTYYDQAIETIRVVLGAKTDKLSEIYNLKAKNYLLTKDYSQALESVQQSLISLVTDFNDLSYRRNPAASSIILDKVELIESQRIKAKILLALFKDTQDIDYLQAAKVSNHLATELVDIVRRNMLYESSKLNLSKQAKAINEQAILIALKLEQETGEPATASVFAAMENSKAYLLTEAIQKAKALGFSNLPTSVVSQEDSFRTKIKVLEIQRNNILLHSTDTTDIALVNQQLFAVKEQLERFENSYAKENRQYQHNMLNLSSYQEDYTSSELIVEYFAGEKMLYAIALNKRKVKVYELADNQMLINAFIGTLTQVQDLSATEYQHAANSVYNVLLAPILKDFKQVKSLVIIPDKQLGFIPFDALVTTQIENPRFDNLAYLLKRYTLLQHQSIALYVDKQLNPAQAPKQFIGFAPNFNDDDLKMVTNNQLRSNLQPLPYAKNEVEAISFLLDGVKEIGNNATEANLKAKSTSFNILHLATHAIIDESNPIYSRLIFDFSDSTQDEDGVLHSFEIYSMKLNCALVTLSACNTGTGKYLDGEGIFSLGRSFLLAGAESVLTSLWEVADLSTSQIMESFYANIKQGASNPAALREAKLKYLASADALTANPHYWAAFVYIGRPVAIYNNMTRYYWMGAILVLLVGFMFVVFFLRKKNFNPIANQ